MITDPLLTVITPVSLDHQQYLGETVALIAGEKAGIIKPRVPVIVAPQSEEGLRVIEARAMGLTAPIIAHGQHWMIQPDRGGMVFQDDRGLWDLPLPNLIGPHQIQNAGTALAALRALGATEAQARAAVTHAEWPARMQRLTRGPLVDLAGQAELWLDGGHNPAGGEALAATLAAMPPRPTHLVCGMLNTKDVSGYLRPLAAHAASLTAIDIPGEPNTLPASETARHATESGIAATTAPDAAMAIRALAAAAPQARILICGSLYLAGRVLRENG